MRPRAISGLRRRFASLARWATAATCAFALGAEARATRAKELSAEALYKRFRPAVVKIAVRQRAFASAGPIAWGAGFFVGSDGRLITNHHVVRAAMRSAEYQLEFTLADGRVIREWSASGCGDERGVDLCALKIPIRPRRWFAPSRARPNPGETVFVIGHPQGYDFSIANGIVSALREEPGKPGELQITAAINPGNSGGPVFNSRGELLGAASKYLRDGQSLNFAVLGAEIADFVARRTRYFKPSDYRKKLGQEAEARALSMRKRDFPGAYARLASGASPAGAAGFAEQRLEFGDVAIAAPLPRIFESCELAFRDVYACSTRDGSAVLTVQRLSAAPGESLLSLDGSRPLRPKPLPIVEALKNEGSWKRFERGLASSVRRTLYSNPGPAKCRTLPATRVPGAFFRSAPACRFVVQNDAEVDALSHSLWLEAEGSVFGFQIWMDDPRLVSYFQRVPEIAALGAVRASRAEPRSPAAAKR